MRTDLAAPCSLLIGCFVAACSIDSRNVSEGEPAAGGGAGTVAGSGAGTAADAEGASGAPVDEPVNLDCTGQVREAPPGEVGFFISLDVSASMLQALPFQGGTKWDAVRASIASFVRGLESDRVAAGIGFFPQRLAGVPDACTSNDECGRLGGPCSNSLCVVDGVYAQEGGGFLPFVGLAAGTTAQNCFDAAECSGAGAACRPITGQCVYPPGANAAAPNGSFINVASDPATEIVAPLCETQADCAGLAGSVCEQIGVCENELLQCTVSVPCPSGAGACVPFPYSCLNDTRCDVAAYSAPSVPIGIGTTPAILEALEQQVPIGVTPTAPALDGAIAHARSWAIESSQRRAVVILATDGFPTQCAPLEVPAIAEALGTAASGPSAIRTFVVGVFSDLDLGQDGRGRLDTLAASGNTGRAFVINPSSNVNAEFSQALRTIQNQIERCEIPIGASPAAESSPIDVDIVRAGDTRRRLVNVADATACPSDGSAWYYTFGTSAGAQINLCPSTCERLTLDERVELEEGCPPP